MFSQIKNSSAWKLLIILILGFASGLPLGLTGQSLQAWLTLDNIDMATIGFFSLVGIPYTFKFIWAPLMDRFEVPFLGRRRGWIIITQLGLALALALMSTFNPTAQTQALALAAVLVAFLSASQDVVINAYTADILTTSEKGMGSSLTVLGYRLAMILSGGIAFIWADPISGNGWSWPQIYMIMAGIMVGCAAISLVFLPNLPKTNVAPTTNAKNDLIGFLALVVVVAIGYKFTELLATPFTTNVLSNLFQPSAEGVADPNLKKWADMLGFLIGLAFTLPLAWFTIKKAKFETLDVSLTNYFSMKSAGSILALIILYKLGDAFAGSLLTPFLLKGMLFAQAEIGVVNKIIGMWLTILGAILGGALMIRIGLYRSLLTFGVLQLLSNLGFYAAAILGKDAWGSFSMPAFNIIIVSLKEATQIDWLLLFAVGLENITGGMGTAAFVALLMALCNQKFTATQYALLSAFASAGRVWVGPMAGLLTVSLGWPNFFLFSTVMAIPGLVMLVKLKDIIQALEGPKSISLADD